MKKRMHNVLLIVVLLGYGLFYMATSVPDKDCATCNQINALANNLRVGRPYVTQVNSCNNSGAVDTICVSVKDTTGVSWTALADTTCLFSKQQNMPTKVVYILKDNVFPRDTLAKVICP